MAQSRAAHLGHHKLLQRMARSTVNENFQPGEGDEKYPLYSNTTWDLLVRQCVHFGWRVIRNHNLVVIVRTVCQALSP